MVVEELQNVFKLRKQKKEKIFIGSFVNNRLLDLYIKNNIDIVRFDLEEFALSHNYKDRRMVTFKQFKNLLKNINLSSNMKFAIDIPFNYLYKENQISGIVDFYVNSKADILVMDLRDDIINIISRIIKLDIPVIVNWTNDFKNEELFERNYKKIYDLLLECTNIGVLMVILNSFPKNHIEKVRGDINIPVISNNKSHNADGYYFEFFKIFDFDGYSQYIKDLILELK
ncbi:MAG TPA: hypothetical protein PLE45_00170 [Spirochaetota bacterium]|nr:hypothetical protein [Spirochaetota bacterium]HOL56004.1 hypothetical protein [Spirochaetota bacterium]HPP03446.1 hypothetical protein [Spirochaetota bacterium]